VKLIKLDGRHNLKRKGYTWAFRFNGWSPAAGKVETTVKKPRRLALGLYILGENPLAETVADPTM